MRIGLTGSIAAGKSTVSKHLCELGAHVLDADLIAREIVEPGTKGLSMLRDAFGEEVITPNGALDRAAMAARVFGDPAALKTLNAITHPLVVARMAELSDLWEAQHPTDVIVWDMALLIECGAWERMDAVWLITAPDTACTGYAAGRLHTHAGACKDGSADARDGKAPLCNGSNCER